MIRGTEEGETLGRWNKQGVGSENYPAYWVVMGGLGEVKKLNLVAKGEGRVEVGSEGCWELKRRTAVEEVEEEHRSFSGNLKC